MKKININIKSLVLLMVFAVVANMAYAQPGQNTVIIQGVYTPTIGEANKINITPELKDTVYKTPDFSYDIMEKKLKTPFKVAPIKPAKLLGEPLNKLYSNYVAAGIGNYTTPYFEFYHSKLRSRNTKYGVHLKHMSSAGSITDYAFPGWSENLVELYGSKFWKKSVFDGSVSYKRDVNHAYGFKPAEFSSVDAPKDADFVQRYNYFDAKFNWYRYRLRKNEMNYNISTNYYYIQDFYRNSEHNVNVNAVFDWKASFFKKIKTERIGIKLSNDFYYNTNDTLLAVNNNLVSITPFYKFDYGILTAYIGVHAQVKADSNTSLFVYPEAKFNLAAIPDVLYFNLNISGGHFYNSMKFMTDDNPFIISPVDRKMTNRKYQINFGLGSSISKSVNFDIQLYYDRYENVALFINDTNTTYNNGFIAIYDNADRVNLQMDIAYQKHEKLRFLLRGNYYVYNMETELHAWQKPSFDVRLSANYNIQDKILIKGEFITYGSSYAKVWENNAFEVKKLSAWADFNLAVEYRYRKKLGMFVKLNNITAARYQRWYNYPSYRFNAMVGLSYIF